MNPELRRNLIVEFSWQRAVAMPVILGLIAAVVGATNSWQAVGVAAVWGFWLLILFWGTRKGAGAFGSELVDNTWDGQRLSSLTARELFLGKLFGSTSFVLYGATVCLVLYALSYALADRSFGYHTNADLDAPFLTWLLAFAVKVAGGLFALTVSMFVAVVLMQRRRGAKGISVTLCQALAIAAAMAATDPFGEPAGIELRVQAAGWYGLDLPYREFQLASLLLFLGWALLGAIRQTRQLLQFRGYRWAWPLFVLFCAVYVAGFAERSGAHGVVADLVASLWMTAIVSTYLALFIEPKRIGALRGFVAALTHGRFAPMCERIPFWLISLLFVAAALPFVVAFGLLGAVVQPEIGDALPMQLPALGGIYAVLVSFFVLRDVLFVVALNLGPHARRADLAALVYLAVLYGIVPALLSAAGVRDLLAYEFFWPIPQFAVGVWGLEHEIHVWPVALEVLAAAAFLAFRWRRYAAMPASTARSAA